MAEHNPTIVRNGFFLPKFKSPIVNYTWLCAIRHGDVKCPKYEEIKIRPCIDPPSKELVVKELLKICRARNPPIELGIATETSPGLPDKSWALFILSTFAPNHPFFAREYCAPKRKRAAENSKLNNDDGFFNGLDHI